MDTKHDKDGMPKVWPWLTEKDMCKGRLDGRNGTHCLIGWAWEVCCRYDATARVRRALALAIRAEDPRSVDIADWNDSRSTSKAQAAALWNRVGELLGYTEWDQKGWRP